MSKMKQPDYSRIGPLLEQGFEIIPLHQAHALGAKGQKVGKAPMGKDWRNRPALTDDEIKQHMTEGGNIGVRLTSKFLIIDIDPRNFPLDGETDKDGNLLDLRPDLLLEKTFGFKIEDYPTVITGSRFPDKDPGTGLHVYMRCPKPEGWEDGDSLYHILHGYKGIEFKTIGRQVVAPGSVHPDSGEFYEWDDITYPPLSEIKDAPAALIEKLWKKKPVGNVHADGADWTPDMLEEWLSQLDPVEYRDHDKWLQIMMGAHSATGGAGLEEFTAWSVQDSMYAHAGATIAHRWDSFDPNAKGGVTVKSLEHISRFLKINVPRDPSADFDDTAEEDLAIASEAPPSEEGKKSWLEKINDDFMLVDEGGTMKIYREMEDYALDRKFWAKYTPGNFMLKHATKKVMIGKRPVQLGTAWLDWPKRREYDGITFAPDKPPGAVGNQGALNLWTGFGVEENEDGSWDLLQQLILEALANGDQTHADYIMDWMAYAVQRPQLPAEVALVFKGGKGSGKGTLGRAFFKLFGRHGMPINSPSLLTGRFNLHMRDLIALFADEAFWAGDKSGESLLKGLVTEPMITFEGKGTNAEQGINCLHIMMASNLDWVVPAGMDGERRFAVFEVNDSWVVSGKHVTRNRKRFEQLNQQLTSGGYGRMLYDLKHREIGQFHPRDSMPHTKALLDQKKNSMSPLEQFIFEVLEDGSPEMWDPCMDEWALDGEVHVTCTDFRRAFLLFAKEGNHRLYGAAASSVIGRDLIKHLPCVFKRKIQRPEGRVDLPARPTIYAFPSLEICRAAFQERIGQQIW